MTEQTNMHGCHLLRDGSFSAESRRYNSDAILRLHFLGLLKGHASCVLIHQRTFEQRVPI